MLSSRLPAYLDAQALDEPALAAGHIDLSCTNPTRHGLSPGPGVLGPLHYAWDAPYEAHPLGAPAARAALARALCLQNQPCTADDVVLCASTSEAFGFLFKMVAGPGDAVAVGRPGYPLVQHLAELEGLRPLFYDSHFDGASWRIDFAGVDRALAEGARAVVVISPNNPTGARIHAEDVAALARRCNAHGALAIFDEVFAAYGRAKPAGAGGGAERGGGQASGPEPAPAPACSTVALHAFFRAVSLGGLSKAACLPQAKLSWIVLAGAPSFRAEARAGLCWVADAALSVGGPVQAALPAICAAMPVIQTTVRARLDANAASLASLVAGRGPEGDAAVGTLLAAEAGWASLLQLSPACWAHAPQGMLEGPFQVALAWLEARAQVRLMAAELFDLCLPRGVVASLLLAPHALRGGWSRIRAIARPAG